MLLGRQRGIELATDAVRPPGAAGLWTDAYQLFRIEYLRIRQSAAQGFEARRMQEQNAVARLDAGRQVVDVGLLAGDVDGGPNAVHGGLPSTTACGLALAWRHASAKPQAVRLHPITKGRR